MWAGKKKLTLQLPRRARGKSRAKEMLQLRLAGARTEIQGSRAEPKLTFSTHDTVCSTEYR